jgi:putative membrane protein
MTGPEPLPKGQGTGRAWIIIISVLLPALVSFLYLNPQRIQLQGIERGTLPMINAWINGSVTVVLLAAYIAIRSRRIQLHKRLMLTATGLSALFLVLYVLQHASFESAGYGGSVKMAYYIVLLTHIALAAVIAPLVLITLVRGLRGRYDMHKRIARWTFPIWLYVGVSGVVVYLMIAPYY